MSRGTVARLSPAATRSRTPLTTAERAGQAVDLLIRPAHGVDSGGEQTCEPIYRRRVSVQRSWYRRFSGSRSRWEEALVGLSLAEYYLMTWRTLWGLGSSHHGAGEKSLTKRTHMSVLLRVDEEEGRAQQQSGESASSLLAAK
jgi:hypothetical protein